MSHRTKDFDSWHMLHVEFAGPVEGGNLLIVVDAYTKRLEVREESHPF